MTRHLTKILLAASAMTVLAAAPAAYSAPVVDAKLNAAKSAKSSTKNTIKLAERVNRNRTTRNRTTRNRTANRTRSVNRSSAVNRTAAVNRNRARTTNRTGLRTNVGGLRNSGLNNRGLSNRGFNNRDLSNRNIRSRVSFIGNNGRGFRTNYRSSLGISFGFGTPGFSSYRWAPTAYSFYRPSFGSFGYYQRSTVCHRIIVDGWYQGYRAPISVRQCSNPWVGSYIVQGSERLVGY